MTIQMGAVYENGVLHPLRPVPLAEHQRVTVTIDAEAAGSAGIVDLAHFALPPEQRQAFCDALDTPPRNIPAFRKLLTEASLFDDHGSAAP